MKNYLFLLSILLISGCASIQTEYPLTKEDTIVVPNTSAFGGPVEVPIKDLSILLAEDLNKAQEKSLLVQKQTQMLETLLEFSKKLPKEVGEITLFFDKGSFNLDYSYLEHERLVSFLDYVVRKSQGRKILFVSIGSSSGSKDDANNIELSVLRSKSPVYYIKKYLVNTPFEIVATYGVGSSEIKMDKKEHKDEKDKFQHVHIIAAFEKEDLPLLPE